VFIQLCWRISTSPRCQKRRGCSKGGRPTTKCKGRDWGERNEMRG